MLSIGYAACHWCHVMERESFEDEVTAALMNEHFVCIKVDREERPDLDAIYMDAAQAMTGSGGWPLTAFLTPDGKPFFAGTYFPPVPQHGLPSFRQVLSGIAEAWNERRDEVVTQGAKIAEHIARVGLLSASDEPLTDEITRAAFSVLGRVFDRERGGFGGAPKFPQPMTLEFALRCAVRAWEPATQIVTTTLDRMADGGIYDHLGGGFARYSTDASWHVPHFEKMLYDNAQLARLYTRAWQVTRDDRYRRVATETIEYLLREMQHAEGGFFSSQDADSEGVEGKFFVWTWDELVALVGPAVATCLGATPEGNWEGTNVLWRPRAVADVAAENGLSVDELTAEVEDARRMLFEVREGRVHPGTDDKVLTAWNALAIGALAEAGRVFGEPAYVQEAVRCAEFVLTHLRDERGAAAAFVAERHRRTAGVRRRLRRDGVGVPHALRDDVRAAVVRGSGDARRRAAPVVPRRRTWRLLPDGFRRRGTRPSAEGAVRQRDAVGELGGRGGPAAARAVHRRRRVRARGRFRAPPDPRRDGGSADRVRAGALRAGPLPRTVEGGRDHRRPGASGHARAGGGGDGRRPIDRTSCWPSRIPATNAPCRPSRCSGIESHRAGRATAYVCERFTCKLPVTDVEALRQQLEG